MLPFHSLSSKTSNKQIHPCQHKMVNLWTQEDGLSRPRCFRNSELRIRRSYKYSVHGALHEHLCSIAQLLAYGEQKANDLKIYLTHWYVLEQRDSFSEQQHHGISCLQIVVKQLSSRLLDPKILYHQLCLLSVTLHNWLSAFNTHPPATHIYLPYLILSTCDVFPTELNKFIFIS